MINVNVNVNGRQRQAAVEPRKLLSDFLRTDCNLTGTHLACEQGVCGSCTVLLDGEAIRSCLMFAIQAGNAEVTTIEGLTPAGGGLSELQRAFREEHGLQCGFCTPGFIVSAEALLARNPNPTEAEVRVGLSGNLCRCTGYQGIIAAVLSESARRTALES